MAAEELLFVYGSLRKGAAFEKAQMLAGRAEHRGPASAIGRLYLIDWYPGFVPGDDARDRVMGDLFVLRDEALLAELDLYEGCGPDNPHPQEYRRKRICVDTPDGAVEAWAYLYNWPVEGHVPIPDGDFLAPR